MTQDGQEQLELHLSAYLDGELDAETRAAVEAHLAQSPEARETLEELRRVASLVGGLPRGAAPEDMGEGVLSRLARQELFGASKELPSVPSTPPGALSFGRLVGAAAILLVVGLAGYLAVVSDRRSVPPPVQLADAEKRGEHREMQAADEEEASRRLGRGTVGTPGARAPDARESNELEAPAAKKPAPRAGEKSAPGVGARAAEASGKGDLAKEILGEPARPAPSKPKGHGFLRDDATDEVAVGDRDGAAPGRPWELGQEDESKAVRRGKGSAPKAPSPRRVARSPMKPSEVVADERGPALKKASTAAYARGRSTGLATQQVELRPATAEFELIRLDDRLKAGATVAELKAHPLTREPVQLVLTAPDVGERARLAWSVRASCVRYAIQDASLLGERARIGADSRFYLDSPGDHKGKASKMFLLRGTPGQVAGMVDDLRRSARGDVKVTLTAAGTVAKGWDKARSAAQRLGAPPIALPAMAKAIPERRRPVVKAEPATTGPAKGVKAAPRHVDEELSTQQLVDARSGKRAPSPREEWLSRRRGRPSAGKRGRPNAKEEAVGPPPRMPQIGERLGVTHEATEAGQAKAPADLVRATARQQRAGVTAEPTTRPGVRGLGYIVQESSQQSPSSRPRIQRALPPAGRTMPAAPASTSGPSHRVSFTQAGAEIAEEQREAKRRPGAAPADRDKLVTVVIRVEAEDGVQAPAASQP